MTTVRAGREPILGSDRRAVGERTAPAADGVRRPQLLELGVGLVVVAAPLAFVPMSAAPFVDVKVALVAAGAVLVWLSGVRLDRSLALLAWAWVGVMGLSMVTGVDWWLSLTGIDSNAGGLVMLGPSAFLLVAGASLPSSLADRVPAWLFATTAVVSVVAVLWRFAPDVLSPLGSNLRFDGATFDHPVILAGITSAALAAAVGVRLRRRSWFVPTTILIASALSLSAKRSGLLAIALGLLVALMAARPGRARSLLIGGMVAGTLLVWAAASPLLSSDDEPLSGVQRFQQLDSDSASARVHITGAMTRAWADRPILGWGVGNAWPAYLTHASRADVQVAHRGIADPHNILLGSAATTGVVGLSVFLALIVVVVRRAWRAPRRLGWAAGAASALFLSHLLQPLNASLTPLLFLLAGIAAGGAVQRTTKDVRLTRLGRAASGALLAAGLVLSMLILASSVLQQWGRSYNSTWSLRAAVALVPGRVWSVQSLAVYRAQDAALGDAEAEAEARELVEDLVRRHPRYPDARMIGVQVGLSMNDTPYAHAWLREQMDLFPSDVESLTPAGLEFLRTGVRPGFEHLQSQVSDADTSKG